MLKEDMLMQIKEEQNKEFKLLKPKMDVVFQSLFNQEHEDITKVL